MCEWTSIFATSTTGDSWGDQEGLRSGQWFWGGVCVRACTSDLLALPAQGEEWIWLLVHVFNASPECRCCWRQHLLCGTLCDQLCPHPVCVSGTQDQFLVDLAKGRVAATSLSLGGAPGWGPTAGEEGPGLRLPEEATTPNTA